jgi:hypothetical protein
MQAFQQQLAEAELTLAQNTAAFPDLSPRSQEACKTRLQQALALMHKLQADLDGGGGGGVEVQVTGLQCVLEHIVLGDIKYSFERTKWSPERFTLDVELNRDTVVLKRNLKHKERIQAPEKQVFLTFSRSSDADHVLQMDNLPLSYPGTRCGPSIAFIKPIHDSATRAAWREIATLSERIKAIEYELLAMGAVREFGSMPKPDPKKYIDKSWFVTNLPEAKRLRASGASLDRNHYGVLKSLAPIDAVAVQARMTALYNEECDALLVLRQYQLSDKGYDFTF